MALNGLKPLSCDVLVIGGGGAGLTAAILAREAGADVLVVSRSRVGYANNTILSKATFAAPSGWADSRDNPEIHVQDTLVGGRFINDRKLVAAVAEGSGAQIAFLERCGVRFFKDGGRLHAVHAPGHSYPRHVRGEHQEGRGITLPLREYARKHGVRFVDRVLVTRLFVSREGRISAAAGVSRDGGFAAFSCACLVLATGGFGQVYLHTNNAPGIAGNGQALAFDLGLPLKDMEFVQFYPTAAGNNGKRLVLYEELIFKGKAVLKNAKGDDIVNKYGLDSPAALTRDRLSQAIMQEILEGRGVEGGVVLDLSRASGGDLLKYQPLFRSPDTREFIVSPTTHFCSGGLITDEKAQTRIPGLFAAGEICGGVHGANRLAGNALSEVFTMGSIAGREAALKAREMGAPEAPQREIAAEKRRLESLASGGKTPLWALRRSLKELMWYKAGIVRHGKDLDKALGQMDEIRSRIPGVRVRDAKGLMKLLEMENMLASAEMVCRAALMRTESRGSHYRSDYPAEDNDKWLKNIVISKEGSGMRLQAVPVPLDGMAPGGGSL